MHLSQQQQRRSSAPAVLDYYVRPDRDGGAISMSTDDTTTQSSCSATEGLPPLFEDVNLGELGLVPTGQI